MTSARRHGPRRKVLFSLVICSLVGTASVSMCAEQPAPGPAQPRAAATAAPSEEETLGSFRTRFLAEFDEHLKDPSAYAGLVARECRSFPEGDLFTFIYPAMAYVNVGLRAPAQREHCARQAVKLIDLAVAAATRRVQAPGGRLEGLRGYQNHATYLGQLNLALGAYRLVGDDRRYDALNKHLSDLLHQALVMSSAAPLRSFPAYSWPFDTIPVILSLRLYDDRTGVPRSREVIARHLAWVRAHATDPKLGLPYSRLNEATSQGLDVPRGCDLSFRLCLLPHLDREYAGNLYRNYVRNHWVETGALAGFAEWPNGLQRAGDVDSGPILMGIGLAATGLGVGAAIAADDHARLQRLCAELNSMDALRGLILLAQAEAKARGTPFPLAVQLDARYATGFLFGDAMMFYCVTWQPWVDEPIVPETAD